jgi:creatinine amidohydrolase/Fe(II)-dependent formamide hydrolase-like protein
MQLETWTSPEVKGHVQKNGLAIVPVGSLEQHGPHAPLGTDTFISFVMSNRLAKKMGGLVIPPVWFGVSDEHMDFAGTITISQVTLCNLITEILISLKASGFHTVVILNGHGGNQAYLNVVKEKAAEQLGAEFTLLTVSYWDKLSEDEKKQVSSLEWGLHANEFETSIISAIFPNMVKKLKNTKNFPDTSEYENGINEKVFRDLIRGTNGVWGDPGQASIKKGMALLTAIESSLTNYLIRELKVRNHGSDCRPGGRKEA